MADVALNERVEAIINAGLDAMGDEAAVVGGDAMELVLAAQSMAVRLALAGCKSHADARLAIDHLVADYFGQAANPNQETGKA